MHPPSLPRLPPRAELIEHRGARILAVDYSGIVDVGRLRAAVGPVNLFIRGQPEGSVLCLLNLSGVPYTIEGLLLFREAATLSGARVRARAVVGLSPVARMSVNVVARASGRPLECFDSEAEAKDWLAAQ